MPLGRLTVTPGHKKVPRGGRVDSQCLVDIGHCKVQVTPDNCAATLISVDQIVEDGHTVKFSKTQTTITDEEGRCRLQYDRAQGSREWTMPMEAMEHITILRQNELSTVSHGTLTITEQAPEQETGATSADLSQPRA